MSLLSFLRPYRWYGKKTAGDDTTPKTVESPIQEQISSTVIEPKVRKKIERILASVPAVTIEFSLSPISISAVTQNLYLDIIREFKGCIYPLEVSCKPMILNGAVDLDPAYLKEIATVYKRYYDKLYKITIKG